MPIKKSPVTYKSGTGIRKTDIPKTYLRFSFQFFDSSDPDICPQIFNDGYVQTLMERLKALSSWTVAEFISGCHKSIRNHAIDWRKTARPSGFSLSDQYDAYTPYQFSLSANRWGRVHGLLIDDTFYIVWLDQNHRLYPQN